MSKYTDDFKLSAIAHYQSNHSYKRTAKHFNLDHKTVELWVKLYHTHGIDGIKRRNSKAVYDTTFFFAVKLVKVISNLWYNGTNTQAQRQKGNVKFKS